LKRDSSRKPSASPRPREKAEIFLRAALSKKATDPALLCLAPLTTLTDYFLIVSARSGRHVKAIADAIMEAAKERGVERLSVEGVGLTNWALLDYGDVIVHIFHEPVREFYDLEGLWAEAQRETFSGDLAEEIRAASEVGEEEEDQWG
jgi:ribosome-associated protein